MPALSTLPFTLRRSLLRSLALGFWLTALALLSGCNRNDPEAPEPAPPAARPNILLITVDTLRADHLSSYGYARATSPTIDALAAAGVRFDQPWVQWPKTGPSFTSMMTSTYPSDNGIVREIGLPLSCRFRLLSEELQAAGYSTQAVVANGALGREFHFDQGFDTYVETWKLGERSDGKDPNGAEAVNSVVAALVPKIPADRPFFLWVHYLDPHFPYQPPAPFKDRFVGDTHFNPDTKIEIVDKPRQDMLAIGRKQVLEERDELAFYVARYDEEIAYTDAQIAELLADLETAGKMKNTLTVFTADHGESLGEHSYFFDHGRFAFETCLRVPLVFHFPGVFNPRVDPAPVELIDLAPTLLDLAGITPEGGVWQGRSLVPRLRGLPADEPQLAFAEAGYATKGGWLRSVRDGRFKMVYAEKLPDRRWIGGEDVYFTLYDLQGDPAETVDVGAQHPEVYQRFEKLLWERRHAERRRVEVDGEECAENPEMDGETEQLLKTLGYL